MSSLVVAVAVAVAAAALAAVAVIMPVIPTASSAAGLQKTQ
jgi:hypothetical protein